jgi:hypothetical protein
MHRTFSDKPLHFPLDQHGIMIERLNGVVHTNVPHLVVHHSPDGWDFGYTGSGPADLALNIVEWQLQREHYRGERITCFDGTCFRAAWEMHQEFKRTFLARDRQVIRIPLRALAAWVAQHKRPESMAPSQHHGLNAGD